MNPTKKQELVKKLDKLLHIQFERGRSEVDEFAPLHWGNHEKYLTLSDAVIHLFDRYLQEEVEQLFKDFESSGPPWTNIQSKAQYEATRDYLLAQLTPPQQPVKEKE